MGDYRILTFPDRSGRVFLQKVPKFAAVLNIARKAAVDRLMFKWCVDVRFSAAKTRGFQRKHLSDEANDSEYNIENIIK